MAKRSVSSWNIMIMAYDQTNELQLVDYLPKLMHQKNAVSWNTLSPYLGGENGME